MIGAAEFAQIGKEHFKSDDQKKIISNLLGHASFLTLLLKNICPIPALKTSGVSSQRFGLTWS
jgi:hypothetical protein